MAQLDAANLKSLWDISIITPTGTIRMITSGALKMKVFGKRKLKILSYFFPQAHLKKVICH